MNSGRLSTALEESWEKFSITLNDDQKSLLRNTHSPTLLLDEITSVHNTHIERSHALAAANKLGPAVQGLLRFGKAFDVIANVYPEVLSLLWGGLRIVIQIVKSYVEFFDNIVDCIHTIGTSLSRMETFERLFPDSPSLRVALEELYTLILAFCSDAKQLFIDAEAKKKRHLIPKRFRIFIQASWSSFSAQFEQTKEDIEKIIDQIDREALAAGLEAAKVSQSRQTLEASEAAQHRLNEGIEAKAQQAERDEQSKWRDAEAVLWQEQQHASSVMLDFVADKTLLQTCQWLSPVDTTVNHELACKSHHPGTCTWVLHSPQFVQWLKEKNYVLWAHAIPGAGKTVLAASVIQCIQSTINNSEALVYYYFDYKNRAQQSVKALLATLVASLLLKYPSFYELVGAKLRRAQTSGRSATVSILRELLLDAASHFQTLYIVVDALDECDDREALFEDFLNLPTLSKGNFKLFSSSRNNADILQGFAGIPHLAVDMNESLVQPDICIFVRAEVTEIIQRQKIKLRDPGLKDEIIDVLSKNADGMFQWVRCQLDQLRKLKTDKAIRTSLRKLPKGLDLTYLRMLQQLVTQNIEDEITQIQRLLRWLTHSTRPLSAEELAEAIAIELDQDAFDEFAVLTDPTDLLRYGEGLVVIKAGKVQLSHFSVREFLVSDTVRRDAPLFYMGEVESNAELTGVCLTYLNFSDFSRTPDDFTSAGRSAHLLKYACSEWVTHFKRVENYEMRPTNLVASLLDMSPVKENFRHLCTLSSTHQVDLFGCTPLHYCAIHGLLEQLKRLLDQGHNIDLDQGPYGSPLNCAVKFDRLDLVRHLVDRGADPKKTKKFSSNDYGCNALHWALDEDHIRSVALELVEYVVDSALGIDVNTIGGLWHPQRPMHYASAGNRMDIVKLLIRFGAELDAPDLDGNTPLAIAVEEGNIDIATFLLDEGAAFVDKDVNHCDSIRESPFSIATLVPTMSGAYWDVVTTLKSHRRTTSEPTHWGFALGAAARDGKLEPLRELLDLNVNTEDFDSFPQRDNTSEGPADEARGYSRLNTKELEARIGTMFSALAPALASDYLDVLTALLNRMTDVLTSLQLKAAENLSFEIHQMITYDMTDSMFCKTSWDQSTTYLAVLIGYLQTAKQVIDEVTTVSRRGIPDTSKDALCILKRGWPSHLRRVDSKLEFHDTLNTNDSIEDNGVSDDTESDFTKAAVTMEPRASPRLKELCERTRIFWHGKRNTRKALHLYFLSMKPPVEKTEVIEFLLRNGCNANELDRAGRTPLYWATSFSIHDVTTQKVSEMLSQYGGKLHMSEEAAVERLRTSILEALTEMVADAALVDVSAIDFSRKSDWNILGRYFYFAKDFESASVAFETSSVYNSGIVASVPVFHYFFCDECNPGDYRDETLIHGYRFVVRDSLDSDLCETCQNKANLEAFPVPSQRWLVERGAADIKMEEVFETYQTAFQDPIAIEEAKKEYKREALITKRAQMLAWVQRTVQEWKTSDTATLVARYRNNPPKP